MGSPNASSASRTKPAKDGKTVSTRPPAARPRRSTVTLSPAAQEIVERFQSATGVSASAAVNQLILRGEPRASRLREANGFLVLGKPARGSETAPSVTLEDIKRAEEAMDREYVERVHHPKPRTSEKSARRYA